MKTRCICSVFFLLFIKVFLEKLSTLIVGFFVAVWDRVEYNVNKWDDVG